MKPGPLMDSAVEPVNHLNSVGPFGVPVLTSRVTLVRPDGLPAALSFGELLSHACAGETVGLHMLVGYFTHDTGSDTRRMFSPDAITRSEIREVLGSSRAERSSMSLAYGELKSDASALAIQSWYWVCRWHAAMPSDAANWRSEVVAEIHANPKRAQAAYDSLARNEKFAGWLLAEEGFHATEIALWRNLAWRCRYSGALDAASRLLVLFIQRLAEIRCGAPVDRKGTFHPKVYVVERGGEDPDTVVLVGSGNWSASALDANEEHGNTELGVAYRLPGGLWQHPLAIHPANAEVAVAHHLVATSREVFNQVARPLASWMDPRALMPPAELVQATRVEKVEMKRAVEQTVVEPFAFNAALQFLRNLLAETVGSGKLAPLQGRVLAEIAPYQEKGAERLVAMMNREGGAILADSTGLGKTWIAMRLIDSHLQTCLEPSGAVVVIVPNSTEDQWRREIAGQGLEAIGGRHGASDPCIRVITHGAFQRLAVDKDHLALCRARLVILDEAHNFRNENSARWRRLRALLSLVPSPDHKRQVLLMTATPINNSLDDIRSLVALIKIPRAELRVLSATTGALGTRFDAMGLSTGRPTIGPFDLDDGESDRLRNLDLYFQQEQAKLDLLNNASVGDVSRETAPRRRILDELLRRLVVRRNRQQCIELDETSHVKNLRFREPRPSRPESIRVQLGEHEPIFQHILRLFQPDTSQGGLTLAVHRWSMTAEADSSGRAANLLALQRVLLLKRLESSTMALLQSLLRLIGLHAWRLEQAKQKNLLLEGSGARDELDRIANTTAFSDILRSCQADQMYRAFLRAWGPLGVLARAYGSLQPGFPAEPGAKDVEDTDSLPMQSDAQDASTNAARALLVPVMVTELGKLTEVASAFLQQLFGNQRSSWPMELMRREGAEWPADAPEARLRVAGQDPKARALFAFLAHEIGAGKHGRKVVVFTQFGDTMHELRSIFEALGKASEAERLAFGTACGLNAEGQASIAAIASRVAYVSSGTDESELQDTLHRFAPYYQIGPTPPPIEAGEPAYQSWQTAWLRAAAEPVDVLITTDVLSEGVNLQDVTTLVHFDLHWNPVRMVQRAGRIDRRLKEAVEEPIGGRQTALEEIFPAGGAPCYAWAITPKLAPRYVNFLLPEKLDDALSLCLTLARKGLAIQSTVGVDCDLGLPGDELEKALRFQIVGPEDFRPMVGATEEAAMTLAKADKYLSTASGLDGGGGNFVFLRHPLSKQDDPFVVRATWRSAGDAESQTATGWLRPTGIGTGAVGTWYPQGAARTTAGDIVGTRVAKGVIQLDRAAAVSQLNLLQKLTLRQRQRLVGLTAEAQRDPRAWLADGLMWDKERAQGAAISLIWAVKTRASGADEAAIAADLRNKRLVVERFEALQIPNNLLQQALKDEVKS